MQPSAYTKIFNRPAVLFSFLTITNQSQDLNPRHEIDIKTLPPQMGFDKSFRKTPSMNFLSADFSISKDWQTKFLKMLDWKFLVDFGINGDPYWDSPSSFRGADDREKS